MRFSRVSFVEFGSIFCFVVVFVYAGECPLYHVSAAYAAFSFIIIYPQKKVLRKKTLVSILMLRLAPAYFSFSTGFFA